MWWSTLSSSTGKQTTFIQLTKGTKYTFNFTIGGYMIVVGLFTEKNMNILEFIVDYYNCNCYLSNPLTSFFQRWTSPPYGVLVSYCRNGLADVLIGSHFHYMPRIYCTHYLWYVWYLCVSHILGDLTFCLISRYWNYEVTVSINDLERVDVHGHHDATADAN